MYIYLRIFFIGLTFHKYKSLKINFNAIYQKYVQLATSSILKREITITRWRYRVGIEVLGFCTTETNTFLLDGVRH